MIKGGKGVFSAFILFGMLCTNSVQAQNMNEVFIGSYALTVAYDQYFADDEASGLQLGYSRDFNRNFGFRGSFYSMEHDNVAGVDVTGLDLSFVGGLLGHGFNVFGGLGLFTEEWEGTNGVTEDFSGLQLLGGIGYSWEQVGLDLIVGLRDASDYENFVNSIYGTNVEASAASTSLNIGFRF